MTRMKSPGPAGAFLLCVLLAGCTGKPEEPGEAAGETPKATPTRSASWSKPGQAFKAEWSWTAVGPGSASVEVTVVPTMPGESLKLEARLPGGASLAGGTLARTVASPEAGAAVTLAFDVTYAADSAPLVPVDVLLIVKEGQQSAGTLPVRDPGASAPASRQKPGRTTNFGGVPARVGGQAAPAGKKDD